MNKFLLRLAQITLFNFLLISSLVLFQIKTPNKQKIIKPKSNNPKVIVSTQSSAPTEIFDKNPLPIEERNPFSEVAKHSQQSDCWMIIEGHIYNISSYFGSHPGGDAVLEKYCGQDASVAFNTKEKNPSSPHSAEARALLQQYLVQ